MAELKFPYQAEWYRKNLEKNRAIRKEYSRSFRKTFPEKHLLQAAKNRAKTTGLSFNLDVTDIVIPEICPILKQPLIKNTRYAPSVDRINPELGYIKGNVWVISRKANVMKNDASLSELKEFAKWIKSLKT